MDTDFKVIIEDESYGECLLANRFFNIGDLVLSTKRDYVLTEPQQYSIQWDYDTHIMMKEPGLFLNHSCDPNLSPIRNENGSYDFYARKEITKGTELNFDYETTEYTVNFFSECLCAEKRCRKKIIGFKKRRELITQLYGDNIAEYLKK